MTIRTVDAREAKRLMTEKGAQLFDIREPMEHARESIPGAKLMPLSQMSGQDLGNGCPVVIFHCQAGSRTANNVEKLAVCGAPEVYLLEGGLAGWKEAGLPTSLDRSKPIELQRQVQIAAGGLVLLGLTLAASASPWFAAISAFVGCGLVFAGLSGWCGMARLLAMMPWNRLAA